MKTRKKEKLPSYFQEVLQKILFTYDTLFKPYPWQWIWPFSLYSVDKRFWIPPPPPQLSRFNCCMFYFEKLPLDNPGFIPFDLTEACVHVCLRERVCTCERVCLCVCVRKVPAGEWRVE